MVRPWVVGLLLCGAVLLVGIVTQLTTPVVITELLAGGYVAQMSTPASVPRTFAVTLPESWKPGSKLSVAIPGHGQLLMSVPPGFQKGQEFMFQLGGLPPMRQGQLRQPAETTQLASSPRTRKAAAPTTRELTDFSLDGMLAYERRIRDAMGKLRNTWQKIPRDILKAKGTMLEAQDFDDAKFIPVATAAKEKGWDPKNPNGFPAGKPDSNNTNGVPGYTYTTNGELLGVADQGEGYYQPKDPEHSEEYLRMLRLDCFGSNAKWRDHSNCAALIHRSHTYPNDDPFRFSGAFGWNPPFPAGTNATNVQGAMAPDQNEYWNYGSDDDFAGAALWNGKKYVPPPPPPPAK